MVRNSINRTSDKSPLLLSSSVYTSWNTFQWPSILLVLRLTSEDWESIAGTSKGSFTFLCYDDNKLTNPLPTHHHFPLQSVRGDRELNNFDIISVIITQRNLITKILPKITVINKLFYCNTWTTVIWVKCLTLWPFMTKEAANDLTIYLLGFQMRGFDTKFIHWWREHGCK